MTKPPEMPEFTRVLVNVQGGESHSTEAQYMGEDIGYMVRVPREWQPAALQSAQPAEVSDEEIEEIARGKSNHIEFARAILALRPQSESKWDGAEEWMPLAWELCAEEHGEEACNKLIWTGGPIPEPWGDRWLQYEDEAKRLISLVRKHVPSLRPQAVPMTEAWLDSAMRLADAYADACFDQGLNQRAEDPNPEAKREKLAEHLRGITAQAKGGAA